MLPLVIFAAVLSLSYGQRTFGDVRKCRAESFESCKTSCEKWHPNYKEWEKVQMCFEEKRKAFEACMVTQGTSISDDTACYPITTQRKVGDSGVTETVPNAVKCYKRCLRRANKKCRKDCTGQPNGNEEERKQKLKECRNDDQVLDCLESTASGSPSK